MKTVGPLPQREVSSSSSSSSLGLPVPSVSISSSASSPTSFRSINRTNLPSSPSSHPGEDTIAPFVVRQYLLQRLANGQASLSSYIGGKSRLPSFIQGGTSSSSNSGITSPSSLPLVGLDYQFQEVLKFMRGIMEDKDNNSLLLVGPQGSGKTALLVNAFHRLEQLHRSTVTPGIHGDTELPFMVVHLNGSVINDDHSALREISAQLAIDIETEALYRAMAMENIETYEIQKQKQKQQQQMVKDIESSTDTVASIGPLCSPNDTSLNPEPKLIHGKSIDKLPSFDTWEDILTSEKHLLAATATQEQKKITKETEKEGSNLSSPSSSTPGRPRVSSPSLVSSSTTTTPRSSVRISPKVTIINNEETSSRTILSSSSSSSSSALPQSSSSSSSSSSAHFSSPNRRSKSSTVSSSSLSSPLSDTTSLLPLTQPTNLQQTVSSNEKNKKTTTVELITPARSSSASSSALSSTLSSPTHSTDTPSRRGRKVGSTCSPVIKGLRNLFNVRRRASAKYPGLAKSIEHKVTSNEYVKVTGTFHEDYTINAVHTSQAIISTISLAEAMMPPLTLHGNILQNPKFRESFDTVLLKENTNHGHRNTVTINSSPQSFRYPEKDATDTTMTSGHDDNLSDENNNDNDKDDVDNNNNDDDDDDDDYDDNDITGNTLNEFFDGGVRKSRGRPRTRNTGIMTTIGNQQQQLTARSPGRPRVSKLGGTISTTISDVQLQSIQAKKDAMGSALSTPRTKSTNVPLYLPSLLSTSSPNISNGPHTPGSEIIGSAKILPTNSNSNPLVDPIALKVLSDNGRLTVLSSSSVASSRYLRNSSSVTNHMLTDSMHDSSFDTNEDINNTHGPFRSGTLSNTPMLNENGIVHTTAGLISFGNGGARSTPYHSSNGTNNRNSSLTFENHLDFVVSCLRSGRYGGNSDGRMKKSVPVFLVIEDFDLFAHRSRQTLLYSLLDLTQSSSIHLAIIGTTTRVDTLSLLEKRLRSRFSSHIIPLPPLYPTAVRDLLKACFELPLSIQTAYPSYSARWNNAVQELVMEKKFVDFALRSVRNAKGAGWYLGWISEGLSHLRVTPLSSSSDVATVAGTSSLPHCGMFTSPKMLQMFHVPSLLQSILNSLSMLEIALLIAICRIADKVDAELHNRSTNIVDQTQNKITHVHENQRTSIINFTRAFQDLQIFIRQISNVSAGSNGGTTSHATTLGELSLKHKHNNTDNKSSKPSSSSLLQNTLNGQMNTEMPFDLDEDEEDNITDEGLYRIGDKRKRSDITTPVHPTTAAKKGTTGNASASPWAINETTALRALETLLQLDLVRISAMNDKYNFTWDGTEIKNRTRDNRLDTSGTLEDPGNSHSGYLRSLSYGTGSLALRWSGIEASYRKETLRWVPLHLSLSTKEIMDEIGIHYGKLLPTYLLQWMKGNQ